MSELRLIQLLHEIVAIADERGDQASMDIAHLASEAIPHAEVMRAALLRTLPLLIRLGDFIGNGELDPARPDSLGVRCDLIGDIRTLLATPYTGHV